MRKPGCGAVTRLMLGLGQWRRGFDTDRLLSGLAIACRLDQTALISSVRTAGGSEVAREGSLGLAVLQVGMLRILSPTEVRLGRAQPLADSGSKRPATPGA